MSVDLDRKRRKRHHCQADVTEGDGIGSAKSSRCGLDPNCELANAALRGILRHQQTTTHLHPANAEAIAEFAEETGAEVLRGALRYPSESGGWQPGGQHRLP
jgi:hypothetical protein